MLTGTAPIDTHGSRLYFADSGPVEGPHPTTLVVLNGAGFDGWTFHKVIPFARRSGVRLVVVNRRGYRRSSPLTEVDQLDLANGRSACLERQALELATMLLWFADTQNTPPLSSEHAGGGIVLLGWDIGGAAALSLLGQTSMLPQGTIRRLERYLRRLILYDCAHTVYGYPSPPGHRPSSDVPGTEREAIRRYCRSMSAYYTHPHLQPPSALGLQLTPARTAPPSVDGMSRQEYEACVDTAPMRTGEFPMVLRMQAALREQARRALFDEARARAVFPAVDVVVVACAQSTWHCVWGAMETERRYAEMHNAGRGTRPVHFHQVPNANHFLHWDDPALFWNIIMRYIT